MPISYIQSIQAGNALRIFLAPMDGATEWALLRKPTNNISSVLDVGALVVHNGTDDVVLDTKNLVNGQTYYYQLYSVVGGSYVADGASVPAVPAATFSDAGNADPLSLLRERVSLGLNTMVARGTLNHRDGSIPTLTAPPLFDKTVFPVVTLQLNSDAPLERALGEEAQLDYFSGATSADGFEHEGWISRVQITIVGWCLNPDERIAMRRALKTILQANLPVFDAAGLVEIDVSQSDQEDFSTFNVPMYQTTATFSCQTTFAVSGGSVPLVSDVVLGPGTIAPVLPNATAMLPNRTN